MREGSRPIRYAEVAGKWKDKLESKYNQIGRDGTDSAFLNRFPVLRHLKDTGKDARFKAYLKEKEASAEANKTESSKSHTVA
jgi:hypothetical protein